MSLIVSLIRISFYIALCLIPQIAVFGQSGTVEVINAGFPGNRSDQLLKRVEKEVLAHKPTLVVLMVGTNDRLNSARFVSPADYSANVETLVDKIRSGGAELILVTPPPCIEALLFTRHDRSKYSDQSPNERMAEVREILIEIASKKNVALVDFHKYLIKQKLADDSETSLLRNLANSGKKDGVHFTAEGYKRLAEQVVKQIKAKNFDTTKVVCFGDSLTHASYPKV